MDADQVGQTPILGREGLLRLVEVVEQLQARARGEEGGSSWTTGKTLAPQWAAKQCWAELPEANRRVAVGWLAVLASRVLAARVPEAGAPGAGVWDLAGEAGRPDRGAGVGAAGRQGR
jgi:hypothetical protein